MKTFGKITAGFVIGLFLIIGFIALIAPSTPSRSGVVNSAGTPTSTESGLKGYADGIYQVGTDIPVGRLKTDGDSRVGSCYWARLKNDSGDFAAITANDMLRGPGSITLKKTDKFIKFSGGCIWRPV